MGIFNLFRKSTAKSNSKISEYTFADGEGRMVVAGEQYRKKEFAKIFKIVKNNKFKVSILPPSQYQIQKGWPEMPFVNVVTEGSSSVESNNWLGYIQLEHSEIDYAEYLSKANVLNMFATISKSATGYYDLTLYYPEDFVEVVSLSHNDDEKNALSKLANRGYNKLEVKLQSSIDDKNRPVFIAKHGDIKLGTLTYNASKKIIPLVKEGYTAKIRLAYFNSPDHNKNYSKLSIAKSISFD